MNILDELNKIALEIGKFPNYRDIESCPRGYLLVQAIRDSEFKLGDYAEQLGFIANKTKGFWTEETITVEIARICEEIGGWPSSDIWRQKYGGVKKAAIEHGGIKYYREKLGINNMAGAEEIKCEQCHIKFIPSIGTNWTRQRFCCSECLVNFFRLRQNERAAERVNQPKICAICNKEFIPRQTTKQKYCRRQCFTNFRKRMDKSVRRTLIAMGSAKHGATCHKLLGYSAHDLLARLQSFDTWAPNRNDWHLDHIFPVKAFIDKGIFDIALICHLDNLQPISSLENLMKGSKYDADAFDLWLLAHK